MKPFILSILVLPTLVTSEVEAPAARGQLTVTGAWHLCAQHPSSRHPAWLTGFFVVNDRPVPVLPPNPARVFGYLYPNKRAPFRHGSMFLDLKPAGKRPVKVEFLGRWVRLHGMLVCPLRDGDRNRKPTVLVDHFPTPYPG